MRTTFSNRLIEQLGDMDLSIRDLSKETGIHHNMLYRYINNKAEPGLDKLVKIALVLDVSIDWLVGLSDSKQCCGFPRSGNNA